MSEWLLSYEGQVRLAVFLTTLFVIIYFERAYPRRERVISLPLRWFNNFAIIFLNIIVVRGIIPTTSVGMAWFAGEKGWGILNFIGVGPALGFLLAVAILDLAIYFQHVVFHAVPLLWRLHRMHHTDLEFDVTTALRFHPLEILISMAYKFIIIIALGPSVLAVIVFEIILNSSAMFNHSNIRLPDSVDRVLRWFIVTPDMHRIHHSVLINETNSNYGFNFSFWDRIFATYRQAPALGQTGMEIGIYQFRELKHLWLHWLLIIPFVGPAGDYPITRRGNPDGNQGS